MPRQVNSVSLSSNDDFMPLYGININYPNHQAVTIADSLASVTALDYSISINNWATEYNNNGRIYYSDYIYTSPVEETKIKVRSRKRMKIE